MKNGKVMLAAYALLFVLSLYFMVNFADMVLGFRFVGEIGRMEIFPMIMLKDITGFLLAAGITGWLFFGKKGHYRKELDKVIDEMLKVVWPGKEETKITTISVFVFVGIMMTVFFVLDFIWSNVTKIIY